MEINESLETFKQFSNEQRARSIFQTPLFFEALKQGRQRPFTLTALDQGKIVGGLMGFFQRGSLLTSRMFSRLIILGGPVISANADLDAIEFLLENLKTKARKLNSMVVEIEFHQNDAASIFDKIGYKKYDAGGEYSAIIDLSKDRQTLFMNLRSNCRRKIKKAIKKGVEVKEVKNFGDLQEFYQIYLDTARRRKFSPYEFSFFEAIWDSLRPKKMADFFLASVKGKSIAGRLNLTQGSKTQTFISCSLPCYWPFHPNHLLAWHSMISAKEQNHSRYFIFEFLPKEKNKKQGIDYFTFKTGFGGQIVKERNYYKLVVSSNRYKLFRLSDKLYTLILQIFKK